MARDPPRRGQVLDGQRLGPLEVARLEVAGRQGVEAVEDQQVRHGPQLAVFLGRRAERPGRELPGQRNGPARVGQRGTPIAADGDRLDSLRSQDRAQAAPAGVPAVVAEGRERDEPLAGRSDRRDLPIGAVRGADPVLGLPGGEPPQLPRRPPLDPRPSTPSPSTKTTEGPAHAPAIARASTPARFAAMAKCDDDRASQSRPVRGLSATTANFADVVSGLPTSGLSAKTSAASGSRGSTPAGVSRARIQVPRPTPPGSRAGPARPGARTGCARGGGRSGGSGRGSRTWPVSLPRPRPGAARYRRRPKAVPGPRRSGRC
jgi:hypothetical protein